MPSLKRKMDRNDVLIQKIIETGDYKNKGALEMFLRKTKKGMPVQLFIGNGRDIVGRIKNKFAQRKSGIPCGVYLERLHGKDYIPYSRIEYYRVMK